MITKALWCKLKLNNNNTNEEGNSFSEKNFNREVFQLLLFFKVVFEENAISNI